MGSLGKFGNSINNGLMDNIMPKATVASDALRLMDDFVSKATLSSCAVDLMDNKKLGIGCVMGLMEAGDHIARL